MSDHTPKPPAPLDLDALPGYEASLDCVHCGLCLQSCPTYRVTGLEPSSPRGRIHLMRSFAEGRTRLEGEAAGHLDDCLGCRACETVCPAGVRYHEMFELVRDARTVRTGGAPTHGRALSFALDRIPNRTLGRILARFLRWYGASSLRGLLARSGLVARFGPHVAMLESLVPTDARGRRRAAGPLARPATGERRGRVALFRGCVADDLTPDVTDDAAALLAAAGFEVTIPAGQTCCGALDHHAGRTDSARRLAAQNVAAFADEGLDAVVSTAAGCGAMLRELDRLLPGAGTALASRVRDISEVLAPRVDALPLGPLAGAVTYDAPCHLIHAQRVAEPPLALLRAIPDLDLRPLAGAELCCGSAGIYNVQHPEMATRILDEKLTAIRDSGATVLATGNPGCSLHIAAGARRAGMTLEVVHPVTLLARSLHAGRG